MFFHRSSPVFLFFRLETELSSRRQFFVTLVWHFYWVSNELVTAVEINFVLKLPLQYVKKKPCATEEAMFLEGCSGKQFLKTFIHT